MLTGELPGQKLEAPSKKVQIDVRLDEVVLRALEKNPALRYQQASVLKTELETIATQMGGGDAPVAQSSGGGKSQMVRIVEVLFGSTLTAPLAIRLVNVSALGFLAFLAFLGYAPLPGMHRCFGFAGFSGFFGLIGFAFLVESSHRAKANAASASSRLPSWLTRLAKALVVVVMLVVILRAFCLESFVIRGGGVEPELPVGSRVLVWKLGLQLSPGDIVAYRHEQQVWVGRVFGNSGADVTVNRNGQPDEAIPPDRIIGKVVSVFWRASGERQYSASLGAVTNLSLGRVLVTSEKVIVEGQATAGTRISFSAAQPGKGWSCVFRESTRFTASLSRRGSNWQCRVQPENGEPVLTLGAVKTIGNLNLSDGTLAFQSGQPRQEADGSWTVTIGTWTAKTGQKVPIIVSLTAAALESDLSFGPVVERVVNLESPGPNSAIDFDSGRVMSLPSTSKSANDTTADPYQNSADYLGAKGADAIGLMTPTMPSQSGLFCINGTFAMSVEATNWDNSSADWVRNLAVKLPLDITGFSKAQLESMTVVLFSQEGVPPKTFLFKTRRGRHRSLATHRLHRKPARRQGSLQAGDVTGGPFRT